MRRRTVLATVGGVTAGGAAGCLDSTRGGSSTRDGTPSPDDRPPAGTWPQVASDARNPRHTSDAGPRDDVTASVTDNPPIVGPTVREP